MQKKDASESVNKEQRSGWKLFLGGLLLLAATALICFFVYPRQNREPVATGSASSGLTQHTESTETAAGASAVTDAAASQTEAAPTQSLPPETQPAPPLEALQTPVGILRFPEEYEGRLQVTESEDNGSYSAIVEALTDSGPVSLYTLVVGDAEPDYLLGTAPDESGHRQNIGLQIGEIVPDPEWTEEETKRINLLQGSVNDLIEQIYALPGFEAEN